MPDTINNTIQQSLFAANRQQVSGGSISRVVCLLEPKAILVAGLNAQGEVFSAKSFTHTGTEWDIAFFSSVCRNELLLRDMKQVKAVFVAADKQTLVPETLFSEDQAALLLRSMYHIQRDEIILAAPLAADKAKIVYALPADIAGMVQQTFGKQDPVPVTAGLCMELEQRNEYHADCLLTPGKAFASLHVRGALQWKQVFDFENAEDIAYRLANVCRQNNIPMADVHINCMASHESLTPVITALESYCPKIKYAAGNTMIDEPQWLPVLYLLQQMNACAS